MTIKKLLWLDDYRDPFEDNGKWLVFSPIQGSFDVEWVKSYKEFVDYISKNGLPSAICFDHDLGLEVAMNAHKSGMSKREARKLKKLEKTGYDCAKWLVDYCIDNNLDLPPYNIQSANPAGKDNIDNLLKNYIKHRS